MKTNTNTLKAPAFAGTSDQQTLAKDLLYFFRPAPWSMTRSVAIDRIADGKFTVGDMAYLREALERCAANGAAVMRIEAKKLLLRLI